MEKPSNGVDILDGYFTCYEDGTVWSNRSNSRVGYISDGGYLYVRYRENGYVEGIPVHRLIAHAYLGMDLSSKLSVDHLNGVRTDNRVSNLEVVSIATNARRAKMSNTITKEDLLMALSTSSSLSEIRKKLKYTGAAIDGLFSDFGIVLREELEKRMPRSNAIYRGKRVRELYSLDELLKMRNDLYTWAEVAKELGISKNTMTAILKEKRDEELRASSHPNN